MSTRRERAEEQRRIIDEMASRAYLIWRHPWRIIRNRRLRAEVRALNARGDALWQEAQRNTRPHDRG